MHLLGEPYHFCNASYVYVNGNFHHLCVIKEKMSQKLYFYIIRREYLSYFLYFIIKGNIQFLKMWCYIVNMKYLFIIIVTLLYNVIIVLNDPRDTESNAYHLIC